MSITQRTSSVAAIDHHVDFCIVGGGVAGLCAAVSAARHGTKVVLMQDRPMLGGNASSEVRMWISGAHGSHMRETGLVEELEMENQYRNPDKNVYLWDGIMYAMAKKEKNIEILLNCSCYDCRMDGQRIISITGWQTTTQQKHTVYARMFADCSGDSVLAPLTGSEYRMGREAQSEFGEDIAPPEADHKTMGMTISICAREESRPSVFIAPQWAYHYTKADLPYRVPSLQSVRDNMWYVELGGEDDSIGDTERIRDELLRIAYGMWDYLKNDPENKEKNRNWRLDWIGMLPGKRESRRYLGDYILTQNDIRSGGHFDDVVAYGGWTMDDHHPGGFYSKERPNIFHPAPSPYGIPFRCLYSRTIPNLMFAGRNISVTHTGLSSTRVLGTCATVGQAVGTASALMIQRNETPRQLYQRHIGQLQQTLMEDDCFLPFLRRQVSALTLEAQLSGDCEHVERLRNGWDRPVDGEDNGCRLRLGSAVRLGFAQPTRIKGIRIVFDSDLNRETLPEYAYELTKNIIHHRPIDWPDTYPPRTLTRSFVVEALDADGATHTLLEEKNFYQRLYRQTLDAEVVEIRFIPLATWGEAQCHLFSLDVYGVDDPMRIV